MDSDDNMDVTLFTTGKKKKEQESSVEPLAQPSVEPSVRPKVRKASAMAAAPKPKPKVAQTGGESSQTSPSNSLFRWRTSADVVADSLTGMSFTVSGTLSCLTHEDLVEMIESCGGRVYKTLAKKCQYLIAGRKASKALKKNALEAGKQVLDEKEFLEVVRAKGRAYKFRKYRQFSNSDEYSSEGDECKSGTTSSDFNGSFNDLDQYLGPLSDHSDLDQEFIDSFEDMGFRR